MSFSEELTTTHREMHRLVWAKLVANDIRIGSAPTIDDGPMLSNQSMYAYTTTIPSVVQHLAAAKAQEIYGALKHAMIGCNVVLPNFMDLMASSDPMLIPTSYYSRRGMCVSDIIVVEAAGTTLAASLWMPATGAHIKAIRGTRCVLVVTRIDDHTERRTNLGSFVAPIMNLSTGKLHNATMQAVPSSKNPNWPAYEPVMVAPHAYDTVEEAQQRAADDMKEMEPLSALQGTFDA